MGLNKPERWSITSPGAFPNMSTGAWAVEYMNTPHKSHFRSTLMGPTLQARAATSRAMTAPQPGSRGGRSGQSRRLQEALSFERQPTPVERRIVPRSMVSDVKHGRTVVPLTNEFLDTQPIPPQLQNPQTARSAPARSFSRAMGRSMGHSPAFGAFHEPIVTPPFTPIPPPNPHLKEAFMRETQRTPTHSARPRRGDMRTNTNERREMSRSDMDQLANYIQRQLELAGPVVYDTFGKRDLNGTGKVSSSFFMRVLANQVRIRLTQPQLERIVEVFADTCSDNMVDYREFLRYFQIGADVEKYAFKPQMRMRTRIF